jgi:hypothetical protein
MNTARVVLGGTVLTCMLYIQTSFSHGLAFALRALMACLQSTYLSSCTHDYNRCTSLTTAQEYIAEEARHGLSPIFQKDKRLWVPVTSLRNYARSPDPSSGPLPHSD